MGVIKAASQVNTFIPPVSRLSKVLQNLRSGYQPQLTDVKSLKLKYAFRNDHWGARHFAKHDLPRIRYANPKLNIEVARIPKTKDEQWKPEMVVELRDGTQKTFDLDQKWSSVILEELLEATGGPSWQQWKAERKAAGLPVVEVPKPNPATARGSAAAAAFAKATTSSTSPFHTGPPKTGAAAVLP